MKKAIFSSDQLPANWATKKRFALWREMWTAQYGEGDMAHPEDRPFATRAEFVPIEDAGAFYFETTTESFSRSRRHAAADLRQDFLIGFSRSRRSQQLTMRERDFDLASGAVMVMANGVPVASRTQGHISWLFASAPLDRMRELVSDAEDRIAVPLDPKRPAVRHLERYVEFLLAAPEVNEELILGERVNTILIDLMTLALGASGESAELAQSRGLRAARTREIIALINARFADPAFSTQEVCRKLGLSQRYMQELLEETGRSFTQRVLELRLQKARAKLVDRRNDGLKIGEIAFACGFGDISYFNQVFRRRFGAAPTHFRG